MKVIHASGKRKTAVARATMKEGKGIVRLNGMTIDNYEPKLYRMKIMEPIILAGEAAMKSDISITVEGGGPAGQAEAARLAVGRVLSIADKKIEGMLLKYDRQLLVADVRRKETRKPNRHGKARSKVQKSYR